MAITDPEAIRYANESIRPLSEQLRALVFQLEALEEAVDRIMPMIPNDATEIVEDGREAEGISRLTGADVHALVQVRAAVLNLVTPEIRDVVLKACVRPLTVR
jgi:hypothetical protein